MKKSIEEMKIELILSNNFTPLINEWIKRLDPITKRKEIETLHDAWVVNKKLNVWDKNKCQKQNNKC